MLRFLFELSLILYIGGDYFFGRYSISGDEHPIDIIKDVYENKQDLSDDVQYILENNYFADGKIRDALLSKGFSDNEIDEILRAAYILVSNKEKKSKVAALERIKKIIGENDEFETEKLYNAMEMFFIDQKVDSKTAEKFTKILNSNLKGQYKFAKNTVTKFLVLCLAYNMLPLFYILITCFLGFGSIVMTSLLPVSLFIAQR